MTNYLIRRLLLLFITLIGISLIVFFLVRVIPGDVIDMKLGMEVTTLTPEQLAKLRAYYGIDKPIYIQYWNWLTSALVGDFGYSITTGKPVIEEIMQGLPITLGLAALAALIGITIGTVTGIISALKPGTIVDWIARIGALLGLSVPQFWLATLIILVLSLYFHWLPTSGGFNTSSTNLFESLKQILFPAICLSVGLSASVMRMSRSSMLEVLQEDYIRTATSKGLPRLGVITIHALKNSLIPVVTIIGIQTGYLLGGSVVVEEIFALPGLGRLTLHAIYERDYALIQAAIIIIALNFILINLLVDVLYAFIDPRIRYE